ncbi:hypothetical protein GCM10023219_11240 [Stakelama sediminis]|uniref:DUF2946 domain-containing protein n=1 Tax=Stakelama sediminis TaxID=463200 RepID=A0A840YW21_9SPHN|nr:DUF2946 family protein [Stakelama sediminis]MBB5717848.1 hypothetical protein [Stakelama sediminis]
MGLGAFRTGLTRAAMLIAALTALAYTLAVPPGFMTMRGADGGVQIVLCSGHGPMTAATMAMPGMDMGHHGKGDQHDKGSDMQCPFAGHAAPSMSSGPAPAPFEARIAYTPWPVLPVTGAAPGRGMSAPPPPSRAPPILTA